MVYFMLCSTLGRQYPSTSHGQFRANSRLEGCGAQAQGTLQGLIQLNNLHDRIRAKHSKQGRVGKSAKGQKEETHCGNLPSRVHQYLLLGPNCSLFH